MQGPKSSLYWLNRTDRWAWSMCPLLRNPNQMPEQAPSGWAARCCFTSCPGRQSCNRGRFSLTMRVSWHLVLGLLYRNGHRLTEALRLRVKDLDF